MNKHVRKGEAKFIKASSQDSTGSRLSKLPQGQNLGPRDNNVVVTSTLPDRLNNNTAIRAYAANGLRSVLPDASVLAEPLEIAADTIRRIRPDMVLAIGSVAVDGDELRVLRQAADVAHAPLVLWLHDDPYEFDYAFRAEEIADFIFTNDSWACLHYRHPRTYHLPLAGCRATYYRPISLGPRETQVFFCGHAHPNRVAFFRNAGTVLSRFQLTLNGTGWPADLPGAVNLRLSPTDVANTAQRSLMTLNLPRQHNIANRRFDLPASTPGPRTFEIALAGSAQLYWVGGLEICDYLQAGSEIILLDSVSELIQVLERGRDEPEHFLRIAEAAQARALREHCYEHRMARLWQIVFPEQRARPAEDDAPASVAFATRRMSPADAG